VEVTGRELRKIPRGKLSTEIGLVFQNPQDQFVTGNVLDEITVGSRSLSRGRKIGKEGIRLEAGREAKNLLQEIGLWRYRRFSPYMLSQGQQRRLAVASLLVYHCGVLVCDEPTYAQDARSLTAIMGLLQQNVTQNGLTLIFSTHDKKLARDYADHVYELKEGALYEIG
jgi:energy-coupling factor transport system ATP-binding protein